MKVEKKLNGVMVFYVDVGHLPPDKAEALMSRIRDEFKKKDKKLKKNGVETIWMPVRPNSCSQVVYMPLSEEGKSFTTQSKSVEIEIN